MEKILIVDDDIVNVTILNQILKSKYDVHSVNNGLDALAIINSDKKPDLVLLDIVMPGMDGYQVCTQVRQEPSTSNLPIIFVSDLSTFDEQVKGIEAGADGYIPKPFKPQSLLMEILSILETKKKLDKTLVDIDEARAVAMTALTTVGEVGNVFKYFRDLSSINSYNGLTQHMFSLFSSFGLDSVIRLEVSNQYYIKSINSKLSKIESALFDNFDKDDQRIKQYKSYCVCKYGHISVLISNMATDNQDFMGRIKDYLATVIEGTDSTVDSIQLKQSLAALHQKDKEANSILTSLISTVERVLETLDTMQEKSKEKSTQIISELISDAENSFFHMGLTESQETELINLINKADNKLQHSLYKDDQLENQIRMLKALIKL